MHLSSYVHLLHQGSTTLADSYGVLVDGHPGEAEILVQGTRFAAQCRDHTRRLQSARERYGDHPAAPPDRLHAPGLESARSGGLGLVRDLHEVYDYAAHLQIAWTIVRQAAQGNRDEELVEVADSCAGEMTVQVAWLTTHLKTASPQALLVAE
jgi:hypothetical protein